MPAPHFAGAGIHRKKNTPYHYLFSILYPSSCCLYNCLSKIPSYLTGIDRFFKLRAGAVNHDLDVALTGTGYPGDLPVRQTAIYRQHQDVPFGF